jgi:hypothetical protein
MSYRLYGSFEFFPNSLLHLSDIFEYLCFYFSGELAYRRVVWILIVSARSFLNTKDVILFVPGDRGSYFSKGCIKGPIDSFYNFIGIWFFILIRGDFLSLSHYSYSRPIGFIIRSLWYLYLGLGIISFSHLAGGSDCHLGF